MISSSIVTLDGSLGFFISIRRIFLEKLPNAIAISVKPSLSKSNEVKLKGLEGYSDVLALHVSEGESENLVFDHSKRYNHGDCFPVPAGDIVKHKTAISGFPSLFTSTIFASLIPGLKR